MMKLLGPTGSTIMDVEAIFLDRGNIVMRGTIMGTMPMSAIIQPQQLRNGLRLTGPSVVFRALWMLLTGR